MPGYLKTEQESFSRLALFLTHLQIISTEKIRGEKNQDQLLSSKKDSSVFFIYFNTSMERTVFFYFLVRGHNE